MKPVVNVRARKVLLSGDHGRPGHDEPAAMAAALDAAGVPARDVFLDPAGFDTYATLARAREVFGVRAALLVSQRYHLPRALYLAGRLGLDATGVAADRHRYALRLWFRAREVGADAKAVLWTGLALPPPRFLGAPIPLDGDGRATRDQ